MVACAKPGREATAGAFGFKKASLKKLFLASVVMVLLLPPAPMPLVAVCCGEGECPVEDCRMECGTTSELPPTTRLASAAAAAPGIVKALVAAPAAIVDGSVLAVFRPLDLPNLSAGLRTPLRN